MTNSILHQLPTNLDSLKSGSGNAQYSRHGVEMLCCNQQSSILNLTLCGENLLLRRTKWHIHYTAQCQQQFIRLFTSMALFSWRSLTSDLGPAFSSYQAPSPLLDADRVS